MLTIEECRTLLGNPDLSDEQVRDIRDTLYAFAYTFIDAFLKKHSVPSPPTWS